MKILTLVFTAVSLSGFITLRYFSSKSKLTGAWKRESGGDRMIMICSEKHFAVTVYNLNEKKFVGTCGGSWHVEGNTFIEFHEFNTMMPEYIGKELRNKVSIKHGKLVFTIDNKKESWTKIDDGTPGKLAGAWLITGNWPVTGRTKDGKVKKSTPEARRTMKILSGTRFQWIAYNTDTKELFGTGGGTYTTQNGKYTENIEFFSRDNSRVGMTLQFDYLLEGDDWLHKGSNSKGDPIDEVWTRRETTGI